MINLSLEYSLNKVGEESIDNIIRTEFTLIEKIELIQALDDDRKKKILLNLGFTKKFVDSI